SQTRVVQVAAGLICDAGRYLIARRKSGVHLGGLWEFPGGKCEPGESLEECLRRELHEELAVTISSPVHFQVIRHAYPEKIVELHFFRCSIVAGQATPVDCAEIRWVDPEDLAQFEFPPADRPVIDALRRMSSKLEARG
ncbi:MAG: 8-oxo-dGTP diphosphatase MutT, partial [Nitrospiraceae bacterium]